MKLSRIEIAETSGAEAGLKYLNPNNRNFYPEGEIGDKIYKFHTEPAYEEGGTSEPQMRYNLSYYGADNSSLDVMGFENAIDKEAFLPAYFGDPYAGLPPKKSISIKVDGKQVPAEWYENPPYPDENKLTYFHTFCFGTAIDLGKTVRFFQEGLPSGS